MALTNARGHYAVIGLGQSGLSCIRHLVKHNQSLVAMDTRLSPPGIHEMRRYFPQIPVYLGGLNQSILMKANEIVVSPGFNFHEGTLAPYQKAGLPIIGDIELFARSVSSSSSVIGITGSNGKSTVTTLLGDMIRASGKRVKIGGNLGPPALDLLSPHEDVDYYVLELSSFQLELTHSLHLTSGVVLNICEDHLDRYGQLSSYIAAKQRLYCWVRTAVINDDDPLTFQNAALPDSLLRFSLKVPTTGDVPCDFGVGIHQNEPYLMQGSTPYLPVKDLFNTHPSQVSNSLAALALASTCSLPKSAVLKVLKRFQGLPHRGEKIGTFSGVTFYNNSKATNIGAAVASIKGIGQSLSAHQKLILIAGGDIKGGNPNSLSPVVSRYINRAILLGKDARCLGKALAPIVPLNFVDSMEEAVHVAFTQTKPGDSVLLAPACSSLDGMFRNFEHRGDAFVKAVQQQAHHHE